MKILSHILFTLLAIFVFSGCASTGLIDIRNDRDFVWVQQKGTWSLVEKTDKPTNVENFQPHADRITVRGRDDAITETYLISTNESLKIGTGTPAQPPTPAQEAQGRIVYLFLVIGGILFIVSIVLSFKTHVRAGSLVALASASAITFGVLLPRIQAAVDAIPDWVYWTAGFIIVSFVIYAFAMLQGYFTKEHEVDKDKLQKIENTEKIS